jgi:hypothetical protein
LFDGFWPRPAPFFRWPEFPERGWPEFPEPTPPDAWRSVTLDGTAVERRFLPVVSYSVPTTGITHEYGLLDDGQWTALYGDRERVFPTRNRVPFLPLLESSWREVTALVVAALQSAQLPPKLAWSFPLDDIVVQALKSSGYWRGLAEGWLHADYPMTDAIASLVPMHPRSRQRQALRMRRLYGDETER